MPPDSRLKVNEGEKMNKYLDLARELKKLVMVILILVRVFGTVSKSIEKKLDELEITGSIETIPI